MSNFKFSPPVIAGNVIDGLEFAKQTEAGINESRKGNPENNQGTIPISNLVTPTMPLAYGIVNGNYKTFSEIGIQQNHPEAPNNNYWTIISIVKHEGFWVLVGRERGTGKLATTQFTNNANIPIAKSSWVMNLVHSDYANVRKWQTDIPYPSNKVDLNQPMLGRIKDGSLDNFEKFFFNCEHPEAPNIMKGTDSYWFCISRSFHSSQYWELVIINSAGGMIANIGVSNTRGAIDPSHWRIHSNIPTSNIGGNIWIG